MPNFMLLSRCENVWPFLTIRALTNNCVVSIDDVFSSICRAPSGSQLPDLSLGAM